MPDGGLDSKPVSTVFHQRCMQWAFETRFKSLLNRARAG
ncbi:hypothetical protein SM11_pC1107 (plasmid) [Sinorhizobium meliloti SM11]|uniref:Uncharacterized protein n=1 Tax=Sinorhizobium meliloti (strain SM11) TaxID=707241 RepID=F7XF55_SINMM|nr:hypothetical protein SM11_pC1107 [Sinorhizobium meliloti SM11]